MPVQNLVPKEIAGWKAEEPDGVYDRKTLFDYIDGGAEVYLAYDFKQALARRFLKEGDPTITADVFLMDSAGDAYGVFTFEREGKDVGIGTDSEYSSGLLRFWESRYFVSILTDRETPASKEAVMDLGKSIAAGIEFPCERPKMVLMLPTKGLAANTVRYLHKKPSLDYHYFLADKNILNMDEKTEVALAQYGTGKAKTRLLVVRYPDPAAALTAFKAFTAAYMPEAKGTGVLKTEDGKWVASRTEKRYVIAVFEAPTKAEATALLANVKTPKEEKTK
jgi:hypothetical protein